MRESLEKFYQTTAIVKKDFLQIATSPMFLAVLGVSCFLWSFSYTYSLLGFAKQSLYVGMGQGAKNIHYQVFLPLMSQMNLLLLFILPALTMRLFAEEKKLKTFDLLMSAPLSAFQIVIGKFLAAYKCAIILVALSFSYILITSFFADFSWRMPLVSYFGMILLSGVYVSLGMLASALSRSVVLSTVLGVIFNLFLWFIGQQGREIFSHPVMLSVMEYLSLGQHLEQFVEGKIVISSLLFFFVLAVFFIFLTVKIIETARLR